MAAPVGALVTIVYDANDDAPILVGDFLVTPARRCYEVRECRRVESETPNRWRLLLLVIEAIPKPRDPLANIHPLVFNPRTKR